MTEKTVAELQRELEAAQKREREELARKQAQEQDEARRKMWEARNAAKRKIWTQIAAALNAEKPEGVVYTVTETLGVDKQEAHFTLKENKELVYGWDLDVTRDRTTHTTAVRGWHNYTDKGTYSITVGGSRKANLPAKRFPQRKDGSHNYEGAAQYFLRIRALTARIEAAEKAARTIREKNKSVFDTLNAEVRYSGYAHIDASTTKQDALRVEVKFGRDLTVEQTHRLLALLKEFDESIK